MTDLKKTRIGIQGIKASFHDVAARNYFQNGDFELAECSSFRRLAETLSRGETDRAVMAIENSVAGSILPNYQLLEKFQLAIIGEIYLRIELNLMALRGQKLEDLKHVQSHPMALFQCEDFLAAHPDLEVLEAADTAESARRIASEGLKGVAAIAGLQAAETYGLEILASGIESNRQNYTRFLVIERKKSVDSGNDSLDASVLTISGDANKSSLRFETPHRPGSLLSVLTSFQTHGLNMTKLQSVPLLGRPYEYSFHVDLEWNRIEDYLAALEELKVKTINLIRLGEYKRSVRPWL